MKTIYVDLMLDNGSIVRIECSAKLEDGLYESIENAMKLRDWWSPNIFDGCRATVTGVMLSRVNMARVIGML